MKAVVLGGGLVGGAIARDLAHGSDYEVRICDISADRLRLLEGSGVELVKADLHGDRELDDAISDADVVVGAVPGFMGFETVRRVIEAGKDVVDISFFPEDALRLNDLAVEKGVRCLVDFGIAPGCSNLICGRCIETFDRIDHFICMVGGLPEERRLPWEYQAPFSPSDVLEEYTRPARILRDGEILTLKPLTERQLVDFPGVGTLEAFLTDGLRTLLRIEGIPSMVEMTLRYPGYVDRVNLLKSSGFLDAEPLDIRGMRISPLEMTSRLLFREWEQGPEDRDLTVMRVEVSGILADGRSCHRVWDMLDRFDSASSTSSMARTTGYTCTAGVRMLTGALWNEVGVHPPEDVGRNDECYKFVMDELAKRNVVFRTRDELTD